MEHELGEDWREGSREAAPSRNRAWSERHEDAATPHRDRLAGADDMARRLAALDRRLVALARSAGGLRLSMGDGLRRLREAGGHLDLGFSSLGAYGFERLGRRPRWVDESARVAGRLAELPLLRAALARGDLGWSMAEILARHATPESEGRLLGEARDETVRAMRERLAAEPGGDGVEDHGAAPEPDVERRTMQVSVDRVTAWAFELTRSLVRMRFGVSDDDDVVEALLAEGMVTLLTRHPELTCRVDAATRAETWDQRRELERRLAELLAEDRVSRAADDPDLASLIAEYVEGREDDAPPREPVALDTWLRRKNAELQTRDRRLGELACDLWACGGWRRLGYASAAQYANERLGCSLASVKARMTLARRCRQRAPEVAHALDAGTIGYEAARLVTRVADGDTVHAWLERAAARTVVHLREEIEAVESIARANGVTPVGTEPIDQATLTEFQELERGMLDGSTAEHLANGGQISVTPQDGPSQISAETPERERWVGVVPLRLRLSDETIAFWRDVQRLFHEAGEAGDLVDFLIRAFWRVWLRKDPEQVAYHDVYERGRYRCASPVCTNRDLTPHHLEFRSHGGGEERSNLVGLCVTCHLDLLHGGRMTARPPAHDIHWTLGREPFLTIHGRELVGHAAADAT